MTTETPQGKRVFHPNVQLQAWNQRLILKGGVPVSSPGVKQTLFPNVSTGFGFGKRWRLFVKKIPGRVQYNMSECTKKTRSVLIGVPNILLLFFLHWPLPNIQRVKSNQWHLSNLCEYLHVCLPVCQPICESPPMLFVNINWHQWLQTACHISSSLRWFLWITTI